MTPETVSTLFNGPGKKYHGVRYPQEGAIVPPLCRVMVLPEDGMLYQLETFADRKFLAAEFDWGAILRKLPKVDQPIEKKRKWLFKHQKSMIDEANRKRSERDWRYLSEAKKRMNQLAFAICYDFFQNEKLAREIYELFSARVIEKLPEKEFTLTAEDIEKAIGADVVIATLGGMP